MIAGLEYSCVAPNVSNACFLQKWRIMWQITVILDATRNA